MSLGGQHKVTVVDLDKSLSNTIPEGIEFSLEVKKCPIDLLIIATPPNSHLNLVKKVHGFSRRIILEKPFATSENEIYEIMELAKFGKIFFSIHAMHGKEIELAREELGKNKLKNDLSITQLFYDPYYNNQSQNLGGPFWDSIFNALGIIYAIFNKIEIIDIKNIKNSEKYFFMSCRIKTKDFKIDYDFKIDWSLNINLKISEITSQRRRNGLLINHSQQSVTNFLTNNTKCISFDGSRLSSHYKSVITDCLEENHLSENFIMAKYISNLVIKILHQT